MKTTIYELLGMIKDNKAPKTILFKNLQWTYDKKEKDYENLFNEWLFDSYVITDILNDELEILETELNAKDINLSYGKLNNPTENEIVLLHKINEIIYEVNNL